MTGADPHLWDRRLRSEGQVRIGTTVFKGLGLGCLGMFLVLIGGICVLVGLFGNTDGVAAVVATVGGLVSLLCALLAAIQVSGRWDDLYVSWDEVGYRHARVPWTEVVSVGDYESPQDRSDRPLTAIVFTQSSTRIPRRAVPAASTLPAPPSSTAGPPVFTRVRRFTAAPTPTIATVMSMVVI